MSTLTDLIDKIDNQELRARISQEVNRLTKQKKFGLVFEEHLPECTPLYDLKVKKGSTVAIRVVDDGEGNRRLGTVNDTYTVLSIEGNVARCERHQDKTIVSQPIDNLVVVAQFGMPIYPYLKELDRICNAPDSKLWHTLIEADNYHALQLLVYLYGGLVDCIYIDPPYNSGARDWKYNNDYVDNNDSYRHSKWLSMMQRRLKVAKQLLNPKDSVLIVTIDEKEYLHLGCLLEEMFPEAEIQMVSSVINPKGSARDGRFSRVDEYIFFVFLGTSKVVPGKTDMLRELKHDKERTVRWAGLMRNGKPGARSRIPSMFYPIFIDKSTGKFHSVGEPLAPNADRRSVNPPPGTIALFPINKAGSEQQWGLFPPSFLEYYKKGYIKFGIRQANGYRALSYLQEGMIEKIKTGDIVITGKNEDGTLDLAYADKLGTKKPATIWHQTSHSASEFGTTFLNNIIGPSKFSYPKSIYAVRDTLRFVVANKPNALIVDFFSGSGTTLHAVNLLNAKDRGNRRCIMVTNNEISAEEQNMFLQKGIKPGEEEWNSRGIARYVTWPRTTCVIKGVDVNGNPLEGEYLDTERNMADGFEANVVFYHLGFLDKNSVALGRQFKELLPLLWLKAGAVGECPKLAMNQPLPSMMVLPESNFAILIDEMQYNDFMTEVNQKPEIETIYIVTDSDAGYREMTGKLKAKKKFQLYRDYLDNFRINRAAR